jgi:hypothetical protein
MEACRAGFGRVVRHGVWGLGRQERDVGPVGVEATTDHTHTTLLSAKVGGGVCGKRFCCSQCCWEKAVGLQGAVQPE